MPKKRSKKTFKAKEPKKIAPIKLPIKKILQISMIFVIIPSLYMIIKHSDYFNLAGIKVIDERSTAAALDEELLKQYRGRNIFDIDIDLLAAGIESDYPTIKRAVVSRTLPDTLEIEIMPRAAVALLSSHEYFPVDRTGMVLPPAAKGEGLPVINGLSIWLNPRAGERLESKQLDIAFLLLDALKESAFRSDYTVTTINATNSSNLSFYLKNGIEVKIGRKAFPDRLKMLKATLEKPDLDKGNIRYVDLRFRDVVIGPR